MVKQRNGDLIDSFDIEQWWRSNKADVPCFFTVLRGVLTHTVNSCSPKAIFSILNDTFDDDMNMSYADYMEYSLQSQYNSRARDQRSKRKAKESLSK